MILEFDLGNTRGKWRLRDESAIVIRGVTSYESFEAIGTQLAGFKRAIKKVWVASVIDPAVEHLLSDWCLSCLQIKPVFARSSGDYFDVTNGYEDPSRLGVDRWLGIIAGYRYLRKSFLLVSFGTAVTVDLVTKEGRHEGGFIAPGLNLMLGSLRQKTYQVEMSYDGIFHLAPGTSTTAAVYGAITAMLIGLIENGRKQSQDDDVELIFTGGDAANILPFYPRAHCMPDLVLDGLVYALDNSRLE